VCPNLHEMRNKTVTPRACYTKILIRWQFLLSVMLLFCYQENLCVTQFYIYSLVIVSS
jgi:hypothetical protein